MTVRNEADLEVLAYRLTPDPENELRDRLINRHMKLTKALASRFVNARHDYDDLCEYALFQLVRIICRAKLGLSDNNIEPYVVTSIKNQLIDYVTFDHLVTVPCGSGGAWDVDRPKRCHYCDIADDHQSEPDELPILTEVMDSCVCTTDQEKVVKLRLANCTFEEIAQQTGLSVIKCKRHWYAFQKDMEAQYVE